MMRLYWLRHGETDWNRQQRLQGNVDIPLNERGIAIAQETARGLKRAGLHFDRVYTSPLSRARETARILCPGQDLWVDPRLREISFGTLEGTRYGAVEALPMPAPGGESSQELRRRVAAFLAEVIGDRENRGRQLLISTHGAVIRGLLMELKGTPHEDFWKGNVTRNCGMAVLEVDEEKKITLRAENLVLY